MSSAYSDQFLKLESANQSDPNLNWHIDSVVFRATMEESPDQKKAIQKAENSTRQDIFRGRWLNAMPKQRQVLLSSHTRHRQPCCPPIIYAGEHSAFANGLSSSVRSARSSWKVLVIYRNQLPKEIMRTSSVWHAGFSNISLAHDLLNLAAP
jgi:hypothetical protein